MARDLLIAGFCLLALLLISCYACTPTIRVEGPAVSGYTVLACPSPTPSAVTPSAVIRAQ